MEELFIKNIPISIRRADREERVQLVCVSVLMNVTNTPVHKKELIVRLTDETDPFFLYTLSISEDDFQSLKAHQGLLVDFASFPQKLIDLLKLCMEESSKDQPKFSLQLQLSPGGSSPSSPCLHVIETNLFRHLTHLALKLVTASDSYLKKYLAQTILNLKELKDGLSEQLSQTKSDLSAKLMHTEELLRTRTKELERMKSDWSAEITALNNEHAAQLNQSKEQSMMTQQELQRKLDNVKKEQELVYLKRIESLEERVSQGDTTNKELTDHKYRSEAAIRELKAKLKGSEEEVSHMRQELSELRKDNVALESKNHIKEKSISQLETRVAVLEQELKDKTQIINKTSELLEQANNQKSSCEGQIEHKQRQIVKLETAFKQTSQEVLKGNEIIVKLQSDIKGLKAKLKLRNTVTTQQEKILNEKDIELGKLSTDLKSLNNDLIKKVEESDLRRVKIEQLETQVIQLREELKTSENVVTWLNKQINDQAAIRGRVPYVTASSSTSKPEPLSAIRAPGYSTVGAYRPQFSSTPNTGSGIAGNILGPSTPASGMINSKKIVGDQQSNDSTPPSTAGSGTGTGPYTTTQQKVLFRGPSKASPLSTHALSSNKTTNNEPFIDPKYLPPELPETPPEMKENAPLLSNCK